MSNPDDNPLKPPAKLIKMNTEQNLYTTAENTVTKIWFILTCPYKQPCSIIPNHYHRVICNITTALPASFHHELILRWTNLVISQCHVQDVIVLIIYIFIIFSIPFQQNRCNFTEIALHWADRTFGDTRRVNRNVHHAVISSVPACQIL